MNNNTPDTPPYGETTRAIHAGQEPDAAFGALATPIYQTASFAYDSVEQAIARSVHLEEGYNYTRVANPTIDALEHKLADLDGAEECIAFASGMGAIAGTFLGLCGSGDHVICGVNIYGATQGLLTTVLQRWNLQVTFVDAREPSNIARAIGPDTRLIYLESPSNPSLQLVDLVAVAQLAHDRGIISVIDNTFAGSSNQQPLKHGIDVVIYSATKYISGHGDTLGGAVLGNAHQLRRIRQAQILVGATISPFNAFLLLRGLQTLPLRMRQHNANAMAVARWLQANPAVPETIYPGLESHPQHELAKTQMSGFGGVICFDMGNDDAARAVQNATKLITIASSLGDVKSLISQPVHLSHRYLTPEERKFAGVTPGLVRLSVGLEDVEDIIADLDGAIGS